MSILSEDDIGIIHLAQQEKPVRCQASVKVIDPGMDSKRVVACLTSWEQAQEWRTKLLQTKAVEE